MKIRSLQLIVPLHNILIYTTYIIYDFIIFVYHLKTFSSFIRFILQILREQLNTPFNDCQELEIVEKSIKEIKENVFHADSVFQDINNRFCFLKQHKINVNKFF